MIPFDSMRFTEHVWSRRNEPPSCIKSNREHRSIRLLPIVFVSFFYGSRKRCRTGVRAGKHDKGPSKGMMTYPRTSTAYALRDSDNQIPRDAGTQIRRDADTNDTHDTHDSAGSACVLSLTEAVRVSLPRGLDPNCLFRFSRALRAFERDTNQKLTKAMLATAFALFWEAAEQIDPTADRTHYDYLFHATFPKVKVPLGESLVDAALAKADANPLPECCDGLEPRLARLLAACWYLSNGGQKSFFLGVRDAARIYSTKNKFIASAMLEGFVRDGRLILETKGTAAGRRASTFRFPSP